MRKRRDVSSHRSMRVERYKERAWAVYAPSGSLIAVTVYRKGAQSIVSHLRRAAVGPQGAHGPKKRGGKLCRRSNQ